MDKKQATLQQQMDQVKEKRAGMKTKFASLRAKKSELKEQHYARLIEFAKQEQMLHDIEWLTTTKANVVERAEKTKKVQEERKKWQEQNKKYRDERNARQEENAAREKARQEVRKAKI